MKDDILVFLGLIAVGIVVVIVAYAVADALGTLSSMMP